MATSGWGAARGVITRGGPRVMFLTWPVKVSGPGGSVVSDSDQMLLQRCEAPSLPPSLPPSSELAGLSR